MIFQRKLLCDWCGNPVAGKKTKITIKRKSGNKVYCDKFCFAATKKFK